MRVLVKKEHIISFHYNMCLVGKKSKKKKEKEKIMLKIGYKKRHDFCEKFTSTFNLNYCYFLENKQKYQ